MSKTQRQITRDDIMDMAEYAKVRKARRADLLAIKKHRRVDVGPYASFYFENYETMWHQVHEMLHIEQGGEEQIPGELDAYNPLIPQGKELVATFMLEIPDPHVRARTLSRLGWIEDKVRLRFAGHEIEGTPEDDIDRTTEDGKTSSVHFITFTFTDEQIAAFKEAGTEAILAIVHDNYKHMAGLPEDTRDALAGDLE